MKEVVLMSSKEMDRIQVLKQLHTGQLSQRKAADLLRLSTRQIRYLYRSYRADGDKGVISKKRGRISNRKISKEMKSSILALVREKYEDFGPTFASEKLKELDNKTISKETLRKWMIEAHLWIPNRKARREHVLRKRRDCFGELCQSDGSIHHWFGEDFPKANATVIIDDATGIITSLYFSESETLDAYYKAMELHFHKYGLPRAFYTDRYSVFQANNKVGVTNMQKSLKALDIQLILANSPQAKGRVERANRTLQDRLIKEFRLRGITSIEEANQYVPEFLEKYNERFSKKPMNAVNAHRPLDGYDLDRLLRRFEIRTLLSGSVFQYNNNFYKVQAPENMKITKGRKVEVRELDDEKIRVYIGETEVKVSRVENIMSPPEMTKKEVMVWKDDNRKLPRKRDFAWKKFNISAPWKKMKKTKVV